MATKMRKLVYWPSDILKKASEVVTEAPSAELIQHMHETMKRHRGAGLSAVQVGVHQRIVVVNPDFKGPTVFINPVIEAFGGLDTLLAEGCLSVPGITELVPRHTEVVVSYQDENMQHFKSVAFTGGIAHVLQHEIEHLDGKMFLQYNPGHLSEILGHMIRLRKSGLLRG